ncbi:MAG: hypothetical protein M1308_21530 [Actinobacteria bacterium]|nr:hypothetical protein [Actinomycetota bacterium]
MVEKPNQIFIAYNYHYKNVQNVIENSIIPALKSLGLECKVAKDEIKPKDFFCKICELIQSSHCFLANLTKPTFNVGLELGLALGLGRDIILIASNRTKIPSDLIRHEVIFYSQNHKEIKNKISDLFNNIRSSQQS